MDVKRNIGICGLLKTFRATRSGDLLNRSSCGLHHWGRFLGRRFINGGSLNKRSSMSIIFWVLIVTAKGTKGKDYT
jgi:hypothetical protein